MHSRSPPAAKAPAPCHDTVLRYHAHISKPKHKGHVHVFAGDLSTLDLLGIFVQLPGHPGSKCALWQGVINVEDVIFLKA